MSKTVKFGWRRQVVCLGIVCIILMIYNIYNQKRSMEESRSIPSHDSSQEQSKEESTQVTVEKPKQEIKEKYKEKPKQEFKEDPREESKEEPQKEPKQEPKERTKDQRKESVENQPPQTNLPKIILYWYKPWGDEVSSVKSEECGSCIVSTDPSKINSPSTGAVLFHFNELNYKTLPPTRNPDQLYVYLTMESPPLVLLNKDLHEFNGIFNWTMSFRRDSDVFHPYWTMSMIMGMIKNQFKDTKDTGISIIMKKKKRLASWIVSNCGLTQGSKKRMKLVDQMVEAGMDIDRRGSCFPNNPPPPGERANRGNGEQIEFIASSKFYLAFENAHHCKDYITEKLFHNSLLAGAVPIVWGPKKEDYEAVVPKHSCIFVDDYADDLTKLVDYVKYLDKNDTAYEEYLHWRKMDIKDMFGYGQSLAECRLCQLINGGLRDDRSSGKLTANSSKFPTYTRKVIKSLKALMIDSEEEECLH